MKQKRGRVLITGTSRGIGQATAEKFLKEGWQVLGASRSDISHFHNADYHHYLLDLSRPESIKSCTDKIKKDFSKIDVLIDCAAIGDEPWENKMDLIALRRHLEVNLIGTINFTENLLSAIKPGGQVIAVSSQMSSLANFDNGECPGYRISKTGLNMYLKTLADRLKNITVSAFDPGWVKTDMGGQDAPRTPDIPARELFELATTPHPTGQFWHAGKTRPW